MGNYVDVKVTVWNRLHFADDTSMEKILSILQKEGIDGITDEELGFKEYATLFESEEKISPEQNEGSATIELYENDTLKWDNSIRL
jgi:hypothetical protein